MNSESTRHSNLHRLYFRFLDNEDAAGFIQSVSARYTVSTLERLAAFGQFQARRAAILALSLVGDYRQNAALGKALVDDDRGVRMLADNGIRELWRRDGNPRQRHLLARMVRLNLSRRSHEVLKVGNELIEQVPWFAEVWNQRAIAHYHLKRYEDSANDCHQTLELNAYHFPAAVGMAHCYLEMQEGFAALECFRRALKLNPDLEDVRLQVDYLQKTLEERS